MTQTSDETEWIAALVSHVTRSEHQWALVKLAANEGTFSHARAKSVLGLTSGGLKGPLDALTDANVLERDAGGYRLTSWGAFAYQLLERAKSKTLADLVGSQLVLASRPPEVDPRAVADLLGATASSVIGASGRYRYIAVCDADADAVEDLLFAVQELGADAVGVAVTKVGQSS